jgi:hypothetical protein
MVGGVDHNRVLQKSVSFEERKKVAQDFIQVVNTSKVGSTRAACCGLAKLLTLDEVCHALGIGMVGCVAAASHFGQSHIVRPIAFKMSPWRSDRPVRAAEGSTEKPGLVRPRMTLFTQKGQGLPRHDLFLQLTLRNLSNAGSAHPATVCIHILYMLFQQRL